MTVHELIERLKAMPQDAPVLIVYDGALRHSCDYLWLARHGAVALCDKAEYVDGHDEKPETAPEPPPSGRSWTAHHMWFPREHL